MNDLGKGIDYKGIKGVSFYADGVINSISSLTVAENRKIIFTQNARTSIKNHILIFANIILKSFAVLQLSSETVLRFCKTCNNIKIYIILYYNTLLILT